MSEAFLGDCFDGNMRRLEAARRWDLILRLARERLASLPDCPATHFWAGMAALRTGDLAAAQYHADEGQAREPEERNAFQLRAELLFKQGRVEESRRCLEDALSRWPDNENFHQMLCGLHLMHFGLHLSREDQIAAVAAAKSTLALKPENLPARFAAVILKYYYALRHDLAEQQIVELRELLCDDPHHARVLQCIGEVCLFKLGSPQRALPWFEQSLASDPHHENTQQLYELARRLAGAPAVTNVEGTSFPPLPNSAATCIDALAMPWESDANAAVIAAAPLAAESHLSTSVDVNLRPWSGEAFEDVRIDCPRLWQKLKRLS